MGWLTQKISRQQLDKCISRHASALKTLDIGSSGLPSYTQYFPNRIGLDIKPGPGTDILASVYDIPFAEGEFDIAICCSVLEHLEQPKDALKEVNRVLKTGGIIIVSVPFLFPIHDAPGDYWRFTKYGLIKLFKDWDIVELKAETSASQSMAVLIQRLCYQSEIHFNSLSKMFLFVASKFLIWMPSPFIKIFGDIKRSAPEEDAFASSFFLVAKKRSHDQNSAPLTSV